MRSKPRTRAVSSWKERWAEPCGKGLRLDNERQKFCALTTHKRLKASRALQARWAASINIFFTFHQHYTLYSLNSAEKSMKWTLYATEIPLLPDLLH
jgi:hypothetical protein